MNDLYSQEKMNELKRMLQHLNKHNVTFALGYDAKTETYTLSAFDYLSYGKSMAVKQIPVPLWTDIYSIDGKLISHSVSDFSKDF